MCPGSRGSPWPRPSLHLIRCYTNTARGYTNHRGRHPGAGAGAINILFNYYNMSSPHYPQITSFITTKGKNLGVCMRKLFNDL